VEQIVGTYKERRDALCRGLHNIGWRVEPPKGTMFVWARIPRKFRHLLSINFSLMLIEEAKVAVAPGLGFGEFGDEYVRFALVENVHRTNQAIRGLRKVLRMTPEEIEVITQKYQKKD
jgi:alanine-synthesizing transaminase